MTQVLIDRATLEQAIDALRIAGELNHQRHCGYKTTGATEAVFVESTTKAIITLRAALANAERVEPDTQRLNWLGQNFYSRENLDFITGRPSKTHTMWVFFAPIKVQGDIRRVLDAAKDE